MDSDGRGGWPVSDGLFPSGIEALAMGVHPPEHCLVHPLPMAPQFVGREEELAELTALWRMSTPGVVALVGLGGAGKTAIAARFLEELCRSEQARRPAGLFVWSFYQEPDVGFFLQELYRYFGHPDSSSTPAKGAGLLHLLREAFDRRTPFAGSRRPGTSAETGGPRRGFVRAD